jgi:hypothetical protein
MLSANDQLIVKSPQKVSSVNILTGYDFLNVIANALLIKPFKEFFGARAAIPNWVMMLCGSTGIRK